MLPRRNDCQSDCAVCVCALESLLIAALGDLGGAALMIEIAARTGFKTETSVELVLDEHIGRLHVAAQKLREITRSNNITLDRDEPLLSADRLIRAKAGETN